MENIKNINSFEANNLIKENKNNPDFTIIDVRTQEEYNQNHLPNAQLINIYDNNFINQILKLDKNKTYLIYCRTGARSQHACNFMSQSGFKNILNLTNGILEWEEKQQ